MPGALTVHRACCWSWDNLRRSFPLAGFTTAPMGSSPSMEAAAAQPTTQSSQSRQRRVKVVGLVGGEVPRPVGMPTPP